MRVLTLTPFYPTACDDADGCFIAEPLWELEKLGIESCVVAVHPFHHGRSGTNTVAPKGTWVRYPAIPFGVGLASAGAFLYASLISRIRKLHQSRRIDLIHSHAALPSGLAAVLISRELKIPCVVTVHGLDAFFDQQVRGYPGRWCKRVAQFVYRSASRVICISEKVCAEVAAGTSVPVKTCVIYNGVDPKMFSPEASESLPETVLSVGNLIPIKGHELLLRALASVLPRYPYVSCEIIGDGSERQRLTTLAKECNVAGKVRFLGRQDRRQVREAMRRCALFALPSWYEGLGCVYLEAMSSEKPVIACRGQGIAEVIQHGNNGWLVGPNNLQELIQALATLLENLSLRRRLGEAARRTVVESFTSAHQAAQLARLYEECVA